MYLLEVEVFEDSNYKIFTIALEDGYVDVKKCMFTGLTYTMECENGYQVYDLVGDGFRNLTKEEEQAVLSLVF